MVKFTGALPKNTLEPRHAGELALWKKAFLVAGLFGFGAMNTILTKSTNGVVSIGNDGQEKTFEKPAFQTLLMFVAMTLVLPLHYCLQYCSRTAEKKTFQHLTCRSCLLMLIPALCDLLATGSMAVAILFMSSSIWQMLRGTQVVFAALLTVLVLRVHLPGFKILGVALAIAGIVAAGTAHASPGASPEAEEQSSTALLGILLVVVGQFFVAAQMIIEDKLLRQVELPPLLVVGVEGVWGCIIMVVLVYPLLSTFQVIDPLDTLTMISHSWELVFMLLLYIFSCASYNIVGMLVTGALSGMMRVMLEASRTLVIWLFNIFWYYAIDEEAIFAEELNAWSSLQLLGLILLVLGQATYGSRIHWPCLHYPENSTQKELEEKEENTKDTEADIENQEYYLSPVGFASEEITATKSRESANDTELAADRITI